MPLLHLVSWNVNGIVKTALQVLPDYQIAVNSSKDRKGYSGTAILSKEKPLEIFYDIGIEEHDQEGRVIATEFEKFFVVTVYTPNSGEDMRRLGYRETWDNAFREYILSLEEKKPVIICGDLNVAHTEIDIARSKENHNKASGYTQVEIDGLEALLNEGFIDTFRSQFPEEVKYSWWNYKYGARERNAGWRIDYFLASEKLENQVQEAFIYNEYLGSDHCPVGLKLNI